MVLKIVIWTVIITLLLKVTINIVKNLRSKGASKMLYIASEKDDENMCKHLIEKEGANVNFIGTDGETAL